MRILFVSAGSQATVFAIAPLAKATRNAGHEVIVTANDDMVPTIVDTGLAAVSVTSLPLKHFVTTGRDGKPVPPPTGPAEEMAWTGRWFGRLAAASLPALRELARDWRPEVVVGGAMSYAAPLLAGELGVRYVRQSIDLTEVTGIDPGAAGELQTELRELGLGRLPQPELFVDICPPSLRPPGAAVEQPMRWIPGNRQRRLERWMYARGTRPRVCVTLGSRVLLMHNVDLLRDLTRAVAALDTEVVVAAPEEVAAGLRAELPDVRAGWVPLDVVAPTCDLMVHHGGGVTTMTALNAGVPQLILPVGTYATVPAVRVAEAGAAITLAAGEDTLDNVAAAVEKMLSGPAYRDGAQTIAREIAALPRPDEIVDLMR